MKSLLTIFDDPFPIGSQWSYKGNKETYIIHKVNEKNVSFYWYKAGEANLNTWNIEKFKTHMKRL